MQVQAIWSALAFEYELNYINPPPSFAENTQRLRSPSQVIHQKNGTCIDLAILICSCLEWIEVYPTMFMLNDHAFPGYWKNEDAYWRFVELEPKILPYAMETENKSYLPNAPWVLGRGNYKEIKRFVDQGHLVPLESVLITSRGGFEESISEAAKYFKNKRNHSFHSMVDVLQSRPFVTPLPVSSS